MDMRTKISGWLRRLRERPASLGILGSRALGARLATACSQGDKEEFKRLWRAGARFPGPPSRLIALIWAPAGEAASLHRLLRRRLRGEIGAECLDRFAKEERWTLALATLPEP